MALAQVTQHPEVFVTWGSSFPDKIKFRKLVGIWPLRLKLRADYCRVSRSFEYGCSCKARCSGTHWTEPDCNMQCNSEVPEAAFLLQPHRLTSASSDRHASCMNLGQLHEG